MKNIPIVIINRDRYQPLLDQVSVLKQKGYHNIVVIDNQSTYQPLLEWYKKGEVDVFYNTLTENSVHAFKYLVEMGHPKFLNIVSDWYVFNDSDIIPLDTVPDNFIEDLINYAKKYNRSKVGMAIKIDDIDLNYPLNAWVHSYESTYWTNGILDESGVELYPHPIDSTFAVHAPHTIPTWSNDTLRAGTPYIVKHAPFYYNPEDLPEDEKYYITHMNKASSNWSSKVDIGQPAIELCRCDVNFKVVSQTDPELDRFWKNVYAGWEESTYNDIIPHLHPDKTFIDIGAWQGPISMVAQKYSKQCICFEPDPIAYSYLVKNININGFKNVIAVNAAVSNETSLRIGNDQLGGGGSSYLRPQNAVECSTISFSNILSQYNLKESDISVIKIDVEGYECVLLKDPILKSINVPKHISLHAGFFADKNQYYSDLKEFFGNTPFPSEEFGSAFIK